MKLSCELIQIAYGDAGTLYSVKLNGCEKSEFELFTEIPELQENHDFHEVLAFLEVMVDKKGFKQRFFKVKEGSRTDSLVALSRGKIRLYCLRWSGILLIVGYGGYKNTKSYQDDPILDRATKVLQAVDEELMDLYRSQDVHIDHKTGEITGKLRFTITIQE